MVDYTTHVRLVKGETEIQSGGRSYTVSRRDRPDSPYSCPIELIAGALGS